MMYMGDREEKPDDVKEDPIALGFEYLGDLQEKSLQVLNDMKEQNKALGETAKKILAALEDMKTSSASANQAMLQALKEFSSKVTESCDDMLAGVKLAREYLEEYKKEKAAQAQTPTPPPKKRGPKPTSLSEAAEQLKGEEPPEEKKKV